MNKKSLQDHIMPVDLALVNYVQDLEALFTAVTGSTEIVEENKKQNVSKMMIVIQNSLVKKVIALSQIIALQLKIVQRTNIVTSKFRYLLIFTAKVE